MIAPPLFIAVYLWRWGGHGWHVCLGCAAPGWLVLFGFHDRIMHVLRTSHCFWDSDG